MSHNHQCLVFEILSFNLYELLRSTQFQVCYLAYRLAFLPSDVWHVLAVLRGEREMHACMQWCEILCLCIQPRVAMKYAYKT